MPRPSGESLCLSEQAGGPRDGYQAGRTEVSQSQWEEIGSIENSSAYFTIKSRSGLIIWGRIQSAFDYEVY